MTAAEILENARPPSDDDAIEKAIAELDSKIWQWTDALKTAHTQLRSSFADRPAPQRPSAALYDQKPSLSAAAAAAAAAHLPSPPPPQWATQASTPPPPPTTAPAWAAPQSAPSHSPLTGQPVWPTQPLSPSSSQPAAYQQAPPQQPAGGAPTDWTQWAQRESSPHTGGHVAQAAPPPQSAEADAMQWPTASTNNWPDSSQQNQPAQGSSLPWPTWNQTDSSGNPVPLPAKKSNVKASKAPKATRQPLPEAPSAEERARKAADEEAQLSELEDAIARRVRLLRRLDPDTAIEKLIEKARQSHAEAAATGPRDDKSMSSSSWWRRK